MSFIVYSNWDNGVMQEYSGEFTVIDDGIGGKYGTYTVRLNNGHLVRARRIYKFKIDGIKLTDCTELRFKYPKVKFPYDLFVYYELVSITTVDGQTVFLSEKDAKSSILGIAIFFMILLALVLFPFSFFLFFSVSINIKKAKNKRDKRRKKKLNKNNNG